MKNKRRKEMKIASQLHLLPGSTVLEKFEKGKEIGFDGIEVWGKKLIEEPSTVDEYLKASEKSGLKISTICAGYRNFLLDGTRQERERAREDIKKLLQIGNAFKAIGLIVVPVFGPPKIPDLSPYKDVISLEKELLLSQLSEIVEVAEKNKCAILLEPLNRYETHFINRLEQAVEFCEKIKSPYLKIMADFFHMNIEEASIPEAIEKAGNWISHVHLADSNRLLPGFGHTDFSSGFKALKKINFENYMALECGVPEPAEENLKKSLRYLKDLIQEV